MLIFMRNLDLKTSILNAWRAGNNIICKQIGIFSCDFIFLSLLSELHTFTIHVLISKFFIKIILFFLVVCSGGQR